MKRFSFLTTSAALGLMITMLPSTSHALDKASERIPPLHGTLALKSMLLSPILHRKITTWVYLPPNYGMDTKSNYPVVYLLHGQPGGWADCFISGRVEEMADKLIYSGQMKPAILVAFDADGPKGANDLTNFCNRTTDNYRVEDFITQELVPYVDATYRTRPDAKYRAIWGYSGGGFGALNLGIHHPDIWKIWASHAGFYEAADDSKSMTEILGPQEQNAELWKQNSPVETIKDLVNGKELHVYLDASPKEEDYDGFETVARELKARGADVDAISRNKAHAWKVIVNNCRDSLLFINKSWG